jgi:hypothetical protein
MYEGVILNSTASQMEHKKEKPMDMIKKMINNVMVTSSKKNQLLAISDQAKMMKPTL